MNKTLVPKKGQIERKWYLVNAEGQILGRLASKIAKILIGKYKPNYTPFLDTGDFVVVTNASKIKVTGKKLTDKIYYRHSGYLGNLKQEKLYSLLERKPETVIRIAVRGMLPKTKLGDKIIKKLKVYKDEKHPHIGQNPVPINIDEIK